MAAGLPSVDRQTADELTLDITIPPQPQLLLDIKKVYPDIDKVAALISRDPAVGAGVLKAVNSPYIGLPKKIIKIEQAVFLLGLDSVMNLVNAVLLRGAFSQQLDPKLLQAFWQSTNDTAMAAGLLAKKLKMVRPDEAFALGLFHNCAMPLMLDKHPDYLEVLKVAYGDSAARISAIENRQFGADHATIGYLIARAWNLPANLMAAIKDHHNMQRLTLNGDNETEQHIDNLCLTLKFAEHFTKEYEVLGGQTVNHEWELHKQAWLEYAQLTEDEFLTIGEDIIEQVQAADLLY